MQDLKSVVFERKRKAERLECIYFKFSFIFYEHEKFSMSPNVRVVWKFDY